MINHVGIGPKILRNLLCLLKALPADKRNAEEAEKCGSHREVASIIFQPHTT